MYAASRSKSALRAIARFTPQQAEQYQHIEQNLCAYFPVVVKHGRFLSPFRFYDIDGYRFFNNDFPFIVLLEVGSADEYGTDTLLIQAIIQADTEPPTQARV